ncbi:MAG: GNAT family N-acetyltransferase [Candidatus Lokiarchaeota archaeon]|nr:GNAT family N-acetyltransferase [Candidatus Lokiarchaeota archaeon]
MSEFLHLKRLQEDQIEVASRVAARAFQDDPLSVYYYPDPIERKIKSVIRCENLILMGILSGEVYTTSSNIEGVAVWHPYGLTNQIIGKQSKEIIRKMKKIQREMFSDPLYTEKFVIISEIFNSLRNKHAKFPHWYLALIAVDPLYQKKGYASMLIRAKLRELDKQNLPCYLNAQNQDNVSLYEHFGFELVGKTKVPNSDFYYHGMLRKKKM